MSEIKIISNNWESIMSHANKTPAPIFSKKDSLGDIVLDFALNKSASQLSSQIDIPFITAKRELINKLKSNRIACRNSASSIRFLRHFDSSEFTECPNCGTDNIFGWEICASCKTSSSA